MTWCPFANLKCDQGFRNFIFLGTIFYRFASKAGIGRNG